MSEVEFAGYGHTVSVKHWQHDFLLKVNSNKINGKIQFVTSKAPELLAEENRVILHVWKFPTWEEKKAGVKAQHTYSQNLSELAGINAGLFRLFSVPALLQGTTFMWDSVTVKLKAGKIIVLPDESPLAQVASVAELFEAKAGDPVWRKVRLKSNS